MFSKSTVDKHSAQQVPISEETQQLCLIFGRVLLALVLSFMLIHQFSLIVQSLATAHLQLS